MIFENALYFIAMAQYADRRDKRGRDETVGDNPEGGFESGSEAESEIYDSLIRGKPPVDVAHEFVTLYQEMIGICRTKSTKNNNYNFFCSLS